MHHILSRSRRLVAASAVAVLALGATACSGDNVVNVVTAAPTRIAANTGDAQSGIVGEPLASPVSVLVTDARGNVAPGVRVNWSVASGGGGIDNLSTFTDAFGVTSVNWTLGSLAGANTLTATIPGGASVTLNANATPAMLEFLTIAGGDAQSVAAGTASQPLVVRATDRFGNALSGVQLSWSVTGAGGTTSSTTTTTAANGTAQVTFTPGAAAGSSIVTASAGDFTTASFVVTRR